MNNVAAYIPVVNRPDLLEQAVENAACIWPALTVIDNSLDQWVHLSSRYHVFCPPVPLSFTQTMNWEMQACARRGKKFCLHMHSDAVVPPGAIEKLLEFAEQIDCSGRKWGVIFTLYDVMAVYNPMAAVECGGYDTTFSAYFSDNDYYRRLRLAGYECVESHIEVGHVGSSTVRSDESLRNLHQMTFPWYRQYYVMKWGGEPDKETFATPFNAGERMGAALFTGA